MAGQKTISVTSPSLPIPPPPPPPPDYVVTGVLTPDATGDYNAAGIHDGLPYYERLDSEFVIWYRSDLEVWFLSEQLDDPLNNCWGAPDGEIVNDYNPGANVDGIATVNEGI